MEGESSEQKEDLSQKAWRKEAQEVDQIIDKLGRHIDAGIKEAVVAFHLIGLQTEGSCEGHADWGTRAPYIDVGGVPKELAIRMKRSIKGGGSFDEETVREMREMKEKILQQLEQLMRLLDDFYRGRRDVPILRRLVLGIRPNGARLYSQGAELQEYYSREEQIVHLNEFREEMSAFKEFLKTKLLYSS